MARVCMRPGCDRPAIARLTYDTISCRVWLDVVLDRQGPVQEICQLHASRLTVPRGWELSDRRNAAVAERIAPAPDVLVVEPVPPPPRPRARVAQTVAVNGDLDDDDDVDDDDDESVDELPESLQATSPLLARAFRSTGHQRSVLTQALPDEHD